MKNILIGISMLLLAFFLLWEQGQQQQELIDQARSSDENFQENFYESNISAPAFEQASNSQIVQRELNASQTVIPVASDEIEKEELFEGLSNDFSNLIFTNQTGAVREVKLKKFSRLSRDYNMSHVGDGMLSLTFEDEDGRKLPGFSSFPGGFKRVKSDPQSIVYLWEIPNRLRIKRHYTREDNSTYVFEHGG